MLLLAGLPESYKNIVMALENYGAAITGEMSGSDIRFCGRLGDIVRSHPSKEPEKKSVKKGDIFCTILSVYAMDEAVDWYFGSGSSPHLTRIASLLSDLHSANGHIIATDNPSIASNVFERITD